MSKESMKNLLLSLLSLTLFLGAAELLARIRYTPRKSDYKWIFEYDKDKVYQLKKNIVGMFAGQKVLTNSHGHRDSEVPVAKQKNTIRVLTIGDSITFGHGVSGNNTYTEFLEDVLNQSTSSYSFDVINTAVPGNAPFQEYFDLKRGLKFDPDIVLIQFTLNDVVEPYRIYKRYGGKGKDYHLVADVPHYDYILSQNSAFYLFLKDVVNKIKYQTLSEESLKSKAQAREIYSTKNLILKNEDPKIEAAWGECLKWLQRIVDLCQEENLECVLFISPFSFQFTLDESSAHPQRILQDFSRKNNIVCIDLLHLLQHEFQQEMTEKYMFPENLTFEEVILYVKKYNEKEFTRFWQKYFLDYDHYNIQGHKYVADILYDTLADLLEKKGIGLE
jgi:lysophospholipase L1-like esterase